MKKITLAFVTAMCCLSWGTPAMAEVPPSASTEIFDFTPFQDKVMLDLFHNALLNGRQYPTMAEFEAAGFNSVDVEFARSHVRPRAIMRDKNKQVHPDLYEKRNLWMNVPTGVGKQIGGYPSGKFSEDVYSMWNYTNLFGSWNHSLFQVSGAWADAAHKHGTDIFSGIKFFESWTSGSGDGEYSALIGQKNPEGSTYIYKYAEPLINCLMFFGTDGINYNWEDNSYSDEDVVAFHKELYRIAAIKNFTNFHIGIYTSNSTLTSRYVDALYGTTETGKTTDLMLNYSGGDFSYGIGSSVIAAENAMGDASGLYTGVWIVSMNRRWSALQENENAKRAGVCLWGEHNESRFMSYNTGATSMEFQSNYQKLLERAFSGGNRNPANLFPVSDTGNNWEQDGTKEPLSTFCGLASFIPERTAIQGDLPFYTHFSLGNGERYNYKGKKTFGNWYNMGGQDVVPTYRWLVYKAGTTEVATNIQPSFTHEDSYIGGSALRLEGTPSTVGTDIILYRAKLKVSNGNPVARIAIKTGVTGETPSCLYLILKKENSDQWLEYAIGKTSGNTWEEQTISLNGIATNDQIEYMGFRVKGEYAGNYNLMVGKLELSDDRIATPASIKDLLIEVKGETTQSLSVKLNWAVNPLVQATRADWGLIYNDEANIDHFEIMYKNGENGKITEIGRTSGWSGYVGNILFESADDKPYIGVRAASIDLKTYSPVSWVAVERSTSSELPAFKDNTYCESVVNPAAEGVDIARVQRYVELFTTTGAVQNLDYHASAPQIDGTQYVNATDNVLKVEQGQTIKLRFKAYDTSSLSKVDGLRFCFAKGYMDLDKSNSFEPDGDELLFDLGTLRKGTPEFETTGYEKEFTIPTDAAPGKSRIRVVFSDAWFAHPGPCGQTAKGFSIDFGVEIIGDNPARPVAPDLHDQGVADEPDRVRDADPTTPPPTGVEEVVTNAGFSTFWPTVTESTIFFKDVEKVWVYTTTGQLVKYVAGNPESMNVSSLVAGMYLVKMEYNNVIRSQKLYKK